MSRDTLSKHCGRSLVATSLRSLMIDTCNNINHTLKNSVTRADHSWDGLFKFTERTAVGNSIRSYDITRRNSSESYLPKKYHDRERL